MNQERHLMDCYHILFLYFTLNERKENLPNVVVWFEENEMHFPVVLGEGSEQRFS